MDGPSGLDGVVVRRGAQARGKTRQMMVTVAAPRAIQ
jgi:hypothetical protein